jgi:hypothetical protein
MMDRTQQLQDELERVTDERDALKCLYGNWMQRAEEAEGECIELRVKCIELRDENARYVRACEGLTKALCLVTLIAWAIAVALTIWK